MIASTRHTFKLRFLLFQLYRFLWLFSLRYPHLFAFIYEGHHPLSFLQASQLLISAKDSAMATYVFELSIGKDHLMNVSGYLCLILPLPTQPCVSHV